MTTTPWGTSQSSRKLAPGIMEYSTAGHGGIHLSKKRQDEMPQVLKKVGGWYEEDCDWALVVLGLPQYFSAVQVETAHETVKSWYPYEYEEFTGSIIPEGESYLKDKDTYERKHAGDYLVTGAWGDWQEGVPEGMVGVIAKCMHLNREQFFLVPKEEYEVRNRYGFVIDLAQHCAWYDHP